MTNEEIYERIKPLASMNLENQGIECPIDIEVNNCSITCLFGSRNEKMARLWLYKTLKDRGIEVKEEDIGISREITNICAYWIF